MSPPCLFCKGLTPPAGARCKTCGREGVQRPAHPCHAIGCNVAVPPKMLMCLPHWRMVPRALQKRVWDTYVPGQERRKDPTADYLAAATAAIRAVHQAEIAAREPLP